MAAATGVQTGVQVVPGLGHFHPARPIVDVLSKEALAIEGGGQSDHRRLAAGLHRESASFDSQRPRLLNREMLLLNDSLIN